MSEMKIDEAVHEKFMLYSGFGDKTKAGELDGNMFAKMAKGILHSSSFILIVLLCFCFCAVSFFCFFESLFALCQCMCIFLFLVQNL